MNELISITELSKSFGAGRGNRKVIDNCSFMVERGKITALIGKSGSGKTTLLNIIGGLIQADSGYITVNQIHLDQLNEDQLDDYRSENIGFIFQDFALISDFTVEENICMIGDLLNRRRCRKRLNTLIDLLALNEVRLHYPEQLSGGEKQRTAIARALYSQPSLILADEPTGNLDRISSEEVFQLLKECVSLFEQTVLLVTHDLTLAKKADRVLVLQDGKVFPYDGHA